ASMSAEVVGGAWARQTPVQNDRTNTTTGARDCIAYLSETHVDTNINSGEDSTRFLRSKKEVQLINQSRAEAGARLLQWDTALAEAARQHCLRMTTEESTEHQYGGEPAVSE